MAYTSTKPGDTNIIIAGPNCESCEAATSGECEAFKAFTAVTMLGEKALDAFTPGLRSTGRIISKVMSNCLGEEESDQYLLIGSMDHGGVASEVRVVLKTASIIHEESGGQGSLPTYRPLEWERHILHPKKPADRTPSGLWRDLSAKAADLASQSS